MSENNVPSDVFQTVFVSREVSASPLILDFIRLNNIFKKLHLQNADCTISLSYGKRVLINARDGNRKEMKQQDIVEIIQCDPLKNIVLAIGKKYPCIETPVHWIIHHARDDVHAIVEIKSKQLYEKWCADLPQTEKTSSDSIERVKAILQTLQKAKKICIRDEGIVIVGLHLKEIEDSLVEIGGRI